MFNMSASEGPKFAETVDEMTERVSKLGPSPLRGGEFSEQPEKAEAVSSDIAQGDTQGDTTGETDNDS